jgi:hypothetical protein
LRVTVFTTEGAAWRHIAAEIARGNWVQEGLCTEVDCLNDQDLITREMCKDMIDRVDGHLWTGSVLRDGGQLYPSIAWAFQEGERDVRVVAALFLAEEADSE